MKKISTASLLLMALVGSANADLKNTETPFSATVETGETASGYNAATGNSKSTATGFGTSAISQGSIAIGAEAGASGNGLTREESEGLINAKVTIGSIEEELARITAPTAKEVSSRNPKEGMFYVDRNVFKTSQDYIDHHQKIMKAVTGIQKINEFIVSILTIVEDDRDLLSHSEGQKIINSFEELKNIVTDNQELFAKSDKTSFLMDKVQILSNAFEKYKDLDVGEKFNRMTTEEFDALKALYTREDYRFPGFIVNDFEINKGILYKGNQASDQFSFLSENAENNLKEIINQYNPSEDNANGDKLAATLATLQASHRQEVDRLKQISTFLSDELKDALTREPDWFKVTAAYKSESFVEKNNSGKSDYMNSVPYQYLLGLIKTLEALEAAGINAELEDVIRSYFAFANTKDTQYSNISSETSPKLSENIINDFETKTREYLAQKAEYDAKVAALNAEKEKAIESFKEVAKKLGYPDPSFDDITTILGSLSPNAISVGYRSYVSGESAVGIGAHGLVVGDKAVSVGANNFVAAHKATALGSDISIGASAPEGSIVIGHASQVAVPVPTANIVIDGKTYEFAGKAPKSAVSVGAVGEERQITNVAAGRVTETSTDAVNGSQLFALKAVFEAMPKGSQILVGGDNINTELPLNFVGEDGVNVTPRGNDIVISYTDKTDLQSTSPYLNVGKEGDIFKINFDDTAIRNLKTQVDALQARPTPVLGVTTKDNQNNRGFFESNLAINGDENIIATVSGDSINLKLRKNVNVDSVQAGGVTINNAGINAGDKVIANVSDGAIAKGSKDAINGGQLFDVKKELGDGLETVKQGLAEQGAKLDEVGKTLDEVGKTAQAAKDKADNSVQYTADKDGVKSVELAKNNGKGTVVKNVAEGEISPTSQDAVNGKQLHDVYNTINTIQKSGDVYNTAINNLNTKVDNLDKRVENVEKKVDNLAGQMKKQNQKRKAGTASTLAVAGLLQAHRDGQSGISAAVGQYQGETALAVGMSRLSDNGKIGVKAALTLNTRKEAGGTVGVGYFW